MKTIIVYDSVYGNTEEIAKAIGNAISDEIKVVRVSAIDFAELHRIDLLIVGSPIHGGRPTPAIQDFLNKVSETAIRGINVAAFDTRYSTRLVRIFGYAAEKIAKTLKAKGFAIILPPESFFVKSKEGPLKDGELKHDGNWAKEIAKQSGSGAQNVQYN